MDAHPVEKPAPNRRAGAVPTPVLILICVVLSAFVAYQLYQRRSSEATALAYHYRWGDALEEARSTGKPLLVNYGGPW